MITHTLPLEGINEAFDLMHAGESIRSVVVFTSALVTALSLASGGQPVLIFARGRRCGRRGAFSHADDREPDPRLSATAPRALDDVTLTIPKGMFGLLGPNGAGKSTLMRTIATLQTPTAGSIRFGDIDVIAEPREAARARSATCRRISASIRASRPTTCSTTWRCSRASPPTARAQDDGRGAAAPGQPVGRAQEGARRLLRRHAPALRHRPGADRQSRADHRRRADRRPRSRGAQPLPQPARRDRRERGGDPLDPHRRGRVRPLPAHGGAGRRPHPARRRAAAS